MGAPITQVPKAPEADHRSVRILAKSVYRELRNNGHSRSDIVAFTNAVLELVTSELRDAQEAAE
jgi:D-alanine-D-alanine ligase-like ATP-grasp enzyme